MRRGWKLKNVALILNVILIHSKRKGNKERVVVEKKTLNHLVQLLLGLQEDSSWKI